MFCFFMLSSCLSIQMSDFLNSAIMDVASLVSSKVIVGNTNVLNLSDSLDKNDGLLEP